MAGMKPSINKHRLIVVAWTLVAILCFIFLYCARKPFVIGGVSDPKAESSLAMQTMTDKLAYGNSRVFVLYKSDQLKVDDKEFVSQVNQSLAGLDHFPLTHHILSPYNNRPQIAANNHAAFAVVVMNDSPDVVANYMQTLKQMLGTPQNLKMYVGGQPSYINDVNELSEVSLLRGELIAFPLCIIVLLYVFRTFVAALLPVILGLINTAIILTSLYVIGYFTELSIYVLNVATILGLAFSLDYTLLVTYRFREELERRGNVEEAVRASMKTAGKAIFYSGLAVIISMASLVFFPINIMSSVGVSGIVVIIVVLASSISMLPALLSLLGHNVNKWPVPFLRLDKYTDDIKTHFWYRTTLRVMKHPLMFLLPTAVFLIALGYPFLHVKPNRADATILPPWTQSRQLQDQFTQYFNANALAPINIVIQSNKQPILSFNNIGDLYTFTHNLQKDNRVDHILGIVSVDPKLTQYQYQDMYTFLGINELDKSVQQLVHNSTNSSYTIMSVISKFPVNSDDTFDLVRKIRQSNVGADFSMQVTGNSAIIIDTVHSVYTLFAKLIIIISVITYLVLLVLLRSVVLPLKAILMNFLSLCVCYGMLVFIFQEGHFSSLLNFTAPGYTDLILPVLLFFSLFGISMDYEVFLLTRIKEIYDQTGDNDKSVCVGLDKSARIITSAALLVVIVTGAFVSADIIFIKAFGLGIALAVAADATIIRLLLVPATMRLLGKWNWYLPKWLNRLLPNFSI